MKQRSRAGAVGVTAICLFLGLGASASPQTQPSNPDAAQKGAAMTNHASGTFEVKLAPQTLADPASALSRMSIDKQFHGDLEATSKGEMLSAMTEVKGSGVYVAVERVTGTLQGRSGTFLLHHTGIMTRGVPQLSVTVVPDSGTGQLAGLAGKMDIKIDDGKHSYTFDYTLAETTH